MITTTTLYSVRCDKCGVELPTKAESKRVAREEAYDLGWKTVVRAYFLEENYCPHCANEKPEKEYYGG